MSKFIVQVEGRLVVEAEDKDLAKEAVTSILALKQPWLKVSYQAAERIAEPEAVSAESFAA